MVDIGHLSRPVRRLRGDRVARREVVVVNGATGAFDSAAVAVALALGAAAIVATGRNGAVLEDLVRRLGPRVRPAPMHGDPEGDHRRIIDAAPGPIDVVLDLLPPEATPAQVSVALRSVRSGGRGVLMGRVREDVAVPYAWLMRNSVTLRGQWMYERASIARLVALVRSGLIQLDASALTSFPLDDVNTAVVRAAAHTGPFRATVPHPQSVQGGQRLGSLKERRADTPWFLQGSAPKDGAAPSTPNAPGAENSGPQKLPRRLRFCRDETRAANTRSSRRQDKSDG